MKIKKYIQSVYIQPVYIQPVRYTKLLLPLLFLSACNSNDRNDAYALLNEARQAVELKSFDNARMLIDSLRSTYPKEFDARREALAFVDTLELEQAKQDLSIADSAYTFKQFEVEDIKSAFVLEKQEKYQTTGYYVTKDYAGSKSVYDYFTEVEEGGALLAVSINRSKGIKYDFTPIEIDLSSDNIPSSIKQLSPKEQQSFEKCYRLARSIKELNLARESKEKFKMKVRFYEEKIKKGSK